MSSALTELLPVLVRVQSELDGDLLLIETTSILDIALDYGFHSHETFSRAFKRHFPMTPSDCDLNQTDICLPLRRIG